MEAGNVAAKAAAELEGRRLEAMAVELEAAAATEECAGAAVLDAPCVYSILDPRRR